MQSWFVFYNIHIYCLEHRNPDTNVFSFAKNFILIKEKVKQYTCIYMLYHWIITFT